MGRELRVLSLVNFSLEYLRRFLRNYLTKINCLILKKVLDKTRKNGLKKYLKKRWEFFKIVVDYVKPRLNFPYHILEDEEYGTQEYWWKDGLD